MLKFNALVPELSVSDLCVSKEFYLDALGFELEYERVEDSFAFISFGDAQLMLEQVNGHWSTGDLKYPYGRGINFQIAVKNIQEFIEKKTCKNIVLYK